jgi:hypothetical protein
MSARVEGADHRGSIQRKDFENPSRQAQNTSTCCSCMVKICVYIYKVFDNLNKNSREQRYLDSSSDRSTPTHFSFTPSDTNKSTVTDKKTRIMLPLPDSQGDIQIHNYVKITVPPSPMNISSRGSEHSSKSTEAHILPSSSVDSFREISDAQSQEVASRYGMERLEYGSI